jgi:diacylglycerol kinase (ATP)
MTDPRRPSLTPIIPGATSQVRLTGIGVCLQAPCEGPAQRSVPSKLLGRRTVDSVCFVAFGHWRTAVCEGQRGGDGMTGRRPLDIGSDDTDLAECGGGLGQRGVAHEDSHAYPPVQATAGARDAQAGRSGHRPQLSAEPLSIGVVHNTGAGDASPPADLLIGILSEAGYQARYRTRDDAWSEALQPPLDLVVAVGGDGTVGEVIRALLGRELPFAILPVGTANNIAKTLGVTGDARSVVDGWKRAQARPFDVWSLDAPAAHDGEQRRFVESFGGGFLARSMAASSLLHPPTLILGGAIDRALYQLRQSVAEAPDQPWEIELDEQDLSGRYIGVEVLNIRTVGPNLPLAPEAEPGDAAIDLVLVRAADREGLEQRLHSVATAQTPGPLQLPVRRGSRLQLVPPRGTRFHLDDELWPPAEEARAHPGMELRISHAGRAWTLA